ncbi:MAG TPA: transketolase [Phycisphaerae bacterium]|nr:transketolase [Phycisphaerae bacterium]HNU45538.1 transketolase [Phycisphaerae bacterium]
MSDTAAVHAKAVELGQQVIRMTSAAGSGHPSTALALVHIVVELMYRQMRHLPGDPWEPRADRLVLSIGHAVPVIYAAWADLGGVVGNDRGSARRLRVEDLAALRALESPLDGHPNPAEGFPFFDAATGSLGQGLSAGAGLALAARLDGSPRRVFVIAGDGEAREGQVWEAADFIVDHRLSNLCAVFSCNGQGQAGPVSPQQSAEAITRKLSAFGWETIGVDGHDPDDLARGLSRFGHTERPLAIVARTVKGWGVDLMQGVNYHGKPVPPDDVEKACTQLAATGAKLRMRSTKWPAPPDPVPAAVCATVSGRASETAGVACVTAPDRPITPVPFAEGLRLAGFEKALAQQRLSTRAAYGAALVALGEADERVVALDGDVSNSTFADRFAARHRERFFECKIAEQNMITTAVGLAAGGKIPFASSFAKFIARAYDQIDMAGITRANIKIVGSHAGVSLGADGPSQMAVSDLAYFRSFTAVDSGSGTPAGYVFHPADAVSAYQLAAVMANVRGLCYLRTHRPDAPFLYPFAERFTLRGCKQLRKGNRLTLVSSGYMVHTVLQAAERLAAEGLACNVFDAYTFPLDCGPILAAARASGGTVLTVEDSYTGGLDAELAAAAAAAGDVRVVSLTARRIPKSARTADEVFALVGVGIEHIIEQAKAL